MTVGDPPGVSTDLHLAFTGRQARVGECLVFDAQILRTGRTLAYKDCKLTVGGELVAVAAHTKYVLGAESWRRIMSMPAWVRDLGLKHWRTSLESKARAGGGRERGQLLVA